MKHKLNHSFSSVAVLITAFTFLIIANIVSPVDVFVSAGSISSDSDLVSDSDSITVSGSDAEEVPVPPQINYINVFNDPLQPAASEIYTHVTTIGSSITVSALFTELGITADPDKVTGISGNSRYFDTDTGTGGSRVIKTRRSFDTLETVIFEFEDGSSLPVTFKDGMYITDISPLCTDISININGKLYSSNSQDSYDEAIPVSGRKPYDLIIDFAELPDKQFSDYEQLEYKLPDGFILPDDFNDLNHTVDIDMALGGKLRNNRVTYDKDTNRIFINWNQSDENAFNNFRGSSTAKFTLALSGNLDPSKGKLVFSADKELKLVQENLHNAIVEKTSTYVPYKINYEIKITSDGTNSNLTLTDEMGKALINPSDVSIRFEGNKHDGDPAYTPTLVSNANGRFVINIPNMDDEDVLIVQYVSAVNVDKIARSANATFDEVGNTARIVGDNDPSDNEAFAWTPEIEFSDIEKAHLALSITGRMAFPTATSRGRSLPTATRSSALPAPPFMT